MLHYKNYYNIRLGVAEIKKDGGDKDETFKR